MRDKRFVAEQRGGFLRKDQHYQLIEWACDCTKHVLHKLCGNVDERIENALDIAKKWRIEKASVGDARKSSVDAIHVANESTNKVTIAVARSAGHAVATAHMADHSLEAANYALKAIKAAGGSIDEERQWQDQQLSSEIRDLVQNVRQNKKS